MDMILQLLSQYPIVGQVVVIMGLARIIFKPICVAIDKIVADTESPNDNVFWEKIKASPVYKGIAFVLDYVGSIKLPKALPVEAPKP